MEHSSDTSPKVLQRKLRLMIWIKCLLERAEDCIFYKKRKFSVKGYTGVGKVLQESWDICIFALVKKIYGKFLKGKVTWKCANVWSNMKKLLVMTLPLWLYFLFNSAERIYESMLRQYLQALFFAACRPLSANLKDQHIFFCNNSRMVSIEQKHLKLYNSISWMYQTKKANLNHKWGKESTVWINNCWSKRTVCLLVFSLFAPSSFTVYRRVLNDI